MPPVVEVVRPAPKSSPGPDSLERWIDLLITHVPIARAGRDPEGVHQLRVAIARLRVLLELHGARALKKELRELRDAAAPLRDLDVHLVRELPLSLRSHLEEERAKAHVQLVQALDDPRFELIIRRLQALPALDGTAARHRLARIARKALQRGRAASKHRRDASRLHRLRCAVRRTRFALDWISHAPKELADLQDVLGVAGDRIAALEHLERAPVDPALRPYRKQLERELAVARKDAHAAWVSAKPLFKTLAALPD